MSFMIGNTEIPGPLVLGPMAGVTDLPFRMLCKEQGADLLYTEMVSAKGILYGNKNSIPLLATKEAEAPIGLQLFGAEPEIMAEAARRLEALPFAFFDINMGCPVPKVVGNGEGSALMQNPKLAGEIVAAMTRAVAKPVTVKIRKGFRENNAVEVATIVEANGAAAIAVHGRTREQYYGGTADWDCIRAVKEAVKIPVIGSGDVTAPADAVRMQTETGCDGVMIARAARGNPWIFAQCKAYMEKGEHLAKPDAEEVAATVLRHARAMILFRLEQEQKRGAKREASEGGEAHGKEAIVETLAMREMRKHIAWYFSGYPGSAGLRRDANAVNSFGELEDLLEIYLKRGCKTKKNRVE